MNVYPLHISRSFNKSTNSCVIIIIILQTIDVQESKRRRLPGDQERIVSKDLESAKKRARLAMPDNETLDIADKEVFCGLFCYWV